MAYPFGQPKTGVGKTLASLRDRLAFELGKRSDVEPVRWNEWINDAYIDLAESLDARELKDSVALTTTSLVEIYTLPDGLFSIRGVAVNSGPGVSEGYAMRLMDVDYYRKRYVETGAPRFYLRDGQYLVLDPMPNGAYVITIDITITPAPLVADTDSPIFEIGKHEALFYLAKQKAAEGLGMVTEASTAGIKVASLLSRKRNPEAVERQNMAGGFRPAFSARDLNRLDGGDRGVR